MQEFAYKWLNFVGRVPVLTRSQTDRAEVSFDDCSREGAICFAPSPIHSPSNKRPLGEHGCLQLTGVNDLALS